MVSVTFNFSVAHQRQIEISICLIKKKIYTDQHKLFQIGIALGTKEQKHEQKLLTNSFNGLPSFYH